jgi:hypothetical protein
VGLFKVMCKRHAQRWQEFECSAIGALSTAMGVTAAFVQQKAPLQDLPPLNEVPGIMYLELKAHIQC